MVTFDLMLIGYMNKMISIHSFEAVMDTVTNVFVLMDSDKQDRYYLEAFYVAVAVKFAIHPLISM